MKIGLLGYGTIGSGVWRQVAAQQDMEILRVLDLRDIPELGDKLTKSFDDIVNDPEIETVVELMGGVQPAFGFLSRALAAGKNAVTANKLMLSYHLRDLLEIAQQSGAKLKIDASVGGGIPFLFNLIRTARADRILTVSGIVNGTTNLILDNMQTCGADFADVLKQAQQAGYAEANPAADIDGIDARSKLCITASLAFGKYLDPETIATEGIRHITGKDVSVFGQLGYTCRLLVYGARNDDGTVTAYIEPTLIAPTALEANVRSNYNMIGWTCVNGDRQCFYGQGAGKDPTATTVVLGITDIMNGEPLLDGCIPEGNAAVDNINAAHRYYVRTNGALPFDAKAVEEGVYLTESVSVDAMHAAAKALREAGSEIFFAGIRDC